MNETRKNGRDFGQLACKDLTKKCWFSRFFWGEVHSKVQCDENARKETMINMLEQQIWNKYLRYV